MKAAVLRAAGAPMDVETISIDKPAAREVLVRTAAVGLCHSDLHFFDGSYSCALPAVLGHEASGVVDAVGVDVRDFAPGDRVIACLSAFCGSCPACLSGRPYACSRRGTYRDPGTPPRLCCGSETVSQLYHIGAFAEAMLVHEHALVKLEDEVPMELAALIGCAVTTGVGAVLNTARVEPGSTVAVIGCGGVGLSAINGAAIVGAGRILAIDIAQPSLDRARQVGATDTINATGIDPVEAVMELTRGGVDYAFEALGNVRTVEQAFEMLAPCGTATVIGMISRTAKVSILANALLGDRKLTGSNMGSNRFRIDMPRYVRFYRDGRLKLDHLLGETIGLQDINQGMDRLRTGSHARSVICFP